MSQTCCNYSVCIQIQCVKGNSCLYSIFNLEEWLFNIDCLLIDTWTTQLIIVSIRQLRQYCSMFQNSYQNGTYFDVFDPKASQDKLKNLFRMSGVQTNNKVFDKDLKTFVMEFGTPTSKMCLPKDEKKDLYLIQQYLVLQIFFIPGMSWNMELVISDLSKTKRRIILSPSTHKTQIKPFFVKTPSEGYKEGVWNNFVVDLYSYIQAFKGQTYRSLDSIYITGHFKLRRIYTTTAQPMESQGQNQSQQIKQINFLPKNYYFPIGVAYATKTNRYHGNTFSETAYETTEYSTKNSSFLKSKPKVQAHKYETQKTEVKTEKAIPSKQSKQIKFNDNRKVKDFLANTNGTELLNRKYKEEEREQSGSTPLIGPSKTAKSIDKLAKKKNLIKTQQMPPKARSSLQKTTVASKRTTQKCVNKAKPNPWRSNNDETDGSHMQISKHQGGRSVDTPNTVSMFKTKNNLGTKFSETKHPDRRSDNYSDSEYVELSQKFSTLTDGKFFKCSQVQQQINNEIQNRRDQQQIEENIEMETNSMYSSSHKKEEKVQQHEQIIESICDSLDRPAGKEKMQMGSSLYGFGQQLMRQFMGDLQRPYSPPIGERQYTQEQLTMRPQQQKQQVELIYDPVLNCYYDHKTHTYYELKN